MLKNKLLDLSQVGEVEEMDVSWAISYGDLVTLLLSFFVIFFTTDSRMQKIQGMNDYLGFQIEKIQTELADLQKKIINDRSLNPYSIKEFQDLKVSAEPVEDSLVITFGAVSFFSSGKTDLNKSAKIILDKFIERYMPYAGSYTLSIKGYTDKRPIMKSKWRFQDNLELSVLRSISAMRYFDQKGIPKSRMEVAGLGELKSIRSILKNREKLTTDQEEAFSRTLVLVVKPDLGDKK